MPLDEDHNVSHPEETWSVTEGAKYLEEWTCLLPRTADT